MKAYIGKYRSWIGPYQLSDLLQYIGISEDRCDLIGDYLSDTWINTFLNWIDRHKHRTIKIKIHNYDIWNLDHTLSLIILPALKLLKEKRGVPGLSKDEELYLPEELRSKPEDYDKNGQLPFEIMEKQWNWIVDEMIFSFQMISNDETKWNMLEIDKRISNGLKLFGVFFRALWD